MGRPAIKPIMDELEYNDWCPDYALNYLREHWQRTGEPPTARQMASDLGIGLGTAQQHRYAYLRKVNYSENAVDWALIQRAKESLRRQGLYPTHSLIAQEAGLSAYRVSRLERFYARAAAVAAAIKSSRRLRS